MGLTRSRSFAAALDDWENEDISGLALVLPSDVVPGGLKGYFVHLVNLFEQSGSAQGVIHYADLAIKAHPAEDPATEALWSKIFRSHLKLEQYGEAYSTMMQNPFAVL